MKNFILKLKQKVLSLRSKFGKKFEITLALLLSVVVVVIFLNSVNAQKEPQEAYKEQEKMIDTSVKTYVEQTEQRLEGIISAIKGVGTAKVFVSSKESTKYVYASEEDTKTSTNESGSTISSSETIIFSKNGTTTQPILELEIYPQIIGVLVVAEGAENEKIKMTILNAVSVALNLEISKIEVLPAENH